MSHTSLNNELILCHISAWLSQKQMFVYIFDDCLFGHQAWSNQWTWPNLVSSESMNQMVDFSLLYGFRIHAIETSVLQFNQATVLQLDKPLSRYGSMSIGHLMLGDFDHLDSFIEILCPFIVKCKSTYRPMPIKHRNRLLWLRMMPIGLDQLITYILSKIFAQIRVQNHIDRDANDRISDHKISRECPGGCDIAIAYVRIRNTKLLLPVCTLFYQMPKNRN